MGQKQNKNEIANHLSILTDDTLRVNSTRRHRLWSRLGSRDVATNKWRGAGKTSPSQWLPFVNSLCRFILQYNNQSHQTFSIILRPVHVEQEVKASPLEHADSEVPG